MPSINHNPKPTDEDPFIQRLRREAEYADRPRWYDFLIKSLYDPVANLADDISDRVADGLSSLMPGRKSNKVEEGWNHMDAPFSPTGYGCRR